jgi:hypothetical protein
MLLGVIVACSVRPPSSPVLLEPQPSHERPHASNRGRPTVSPTLFPLPPADFDPASVPWIGDIETGTTQYGYENGVWTGSLSGPLARIADVGRDGFADAERFYYLAWEDPEKSLPYDLWVKEPGTAPRRIGPVHSPYIVASGIDTVYAIDVGPMFEDRGVLAVP